MKNYNGKNNPNYKHGLRNHPIYETWVAMRARCNNPNNQSYKNYGGRGITYDSAWENFEVFLADMGERPEHTTLERVDVNGNYCKENCIWATRKVQGNNTRANVLITYNNKTQTIAQWADELEIHYQTLYNRIFYYGWNVEKAFTTAASARNKSNIILTDGLVVYARRLRGTGLSYREIANKLNLSRKGITKAIKGETWADVKDDGKPLCFYATTFKELLTMYS